LLSTLRRENTTGLKINQYDSPEKDFMLKIEYVTNMDEKEDKKCPHCRHSFPLDFRICPHCGKKYKKNRVFEYTI